MFPQTPRQSQQGCYYIEYYTVIFYTNQCGFLRVLIHQCRRWIELLTLKPSTVVETGQLSLDIGQPNPTQPIQDKPLFGEATVIQGYNANCLTYIRGISNSERGNASRFGIIPIRMGLLSE